MGCGGVELFVVPYGGHARRLSRRFGVVAGGLWLGVFGVMAAVLKDLVCHQRPARSFKRPKP